MKKIMFTDSLTEATLKGYKNMSRRIISNQKLSRANRFVQKIHGTGNDFLDYLLEHSRYKKGEIVAIAQSYHSLFEGGYLRPEDHISEDSAGYKNKMYVQAELMPHQIKITDVRIERLQDISDYDCLKEGIFALNSHEIGYGIPYVYVFTDSKLAYFTPREAYKALINKICGTGTWEKNNWVEVYEYKRIS